MGSRILLNLLLLPKFRLSSARLRSAAAREQGFSLAVVLLAMLSVVVAGFALANRTQTGQLAATLSSSNREAREAADAGITHVLSEWNRKENRGILSALQPMTAWQTTNNALKNPCNNKLTPTATATSDLASGSPIAIDANRSFRLTEVIFTNGADKFVAQPGVSTTASTTFTPSEIDIVVEGVFQRGNNTNKAQATKRLTLAQVTNCVGGGGGGGGTGDGFFAFGGNNPGSALSFNRPLTFYDNNGKIDSKPADNIICLPITASTGGCPPSTAKGIPAGVTIVAPELSAADKAALNPPTFASIAAAAGKTAGSLNVTKAPITFDGDESNCIEFEGASHCSVSSIDIKSGNITVDTTKNPVYLYVSGNVTLRGSADIVHVNKGNPVTSDQFTKYSDYQDTTFRFQIRGQPVSNGSTSQTFKFAGNPSANLFFWAPNATLDLRGNAGFTSALFVNSLTTKGSSSTIKLVGLPQTFITSTGFNPGGAGGTIPSLVARSTVFTKFF